jgi:hypothetical protein
MTGAARSFSRVFSGGEDMSSDEIASAGGADCPDAFELLETHRQWFGGGREAAEPGSSAESSDVTTAERQDASREQGTVVYRIVRSEPDAACESEESREASVAAEAERQKSIAETLALAERVFQQLPELPQHSRLQASLSALEAALTGTTLSDLETALAEQEISMRQQAS